LTGNIIGKKKGKIAKRSIKDRKVKINFNLLLKKPTFGKRKSAVQRRARYSTVKIM
jgi:hypothetical protein